MVLLGLHSPHTSPGTPLFIHLNDHINPNFTPFTASLRIWLLYMQSYKINSGGYNHGNANQVQPHHLNRLSWAYCSNKGQSGFQEPVETSYES